MRRIAPLLLSIGISLSGGQAQPAPKTAADLPAAPRRVLEAMLAGRVQGLDALIRTHFHPRAFERRPIERIAASLREAMTAGGGLEIKQVWKASPEEAVVVLATRSRVTDFLGRAAVRWMYFEAVCEPAGAPGQGKIADFTLSAIPDPTPGADAAMVFPVSVPASETAVAAEIGSRAALLARQDRFSGAILIAKGDRIIYQGAFGTAEKNHGAPLTMDSVFHMASATKMLTAVAVAQLVGAGRLRYDERLIEAWPDFPNRVAAEKITLAHLLGHTSGLGDGLIPEVQRPEAAGMSLSEAIRLSAGKPLLFEPGSRWSYSNLGYMVLGRIVELASGLGYEDYVRRHVCEPAGMTRTGNFALVDVIPGLAVGYGRQADDPLGIRERHAYWPLVLGFRGISAGGYFSTAPDMLRFLRALRTGRLIPLPAAEEITSPKRRLGSDRAYAYGFWSLSLNGKSVRGHGGGGPGYGINTEANTFWTPGGEDRDYAVVVLSNYDPPTGQDFSRAVLEFLSRAK